MNSIFKRRSIRSYTDQKVSDEDLQLLLKAAMSAPSAGNQQPWDFIVLQERESMLKILEAHPHAKMLELAPLAIVVCGNKDYQKFEAEFWIQDCSAAIQNILIQAVELNLGAVWLGVYPLEERVNKIKEILNLPTQVTPLAVISIGHPDKDPATKDTYKEDRVHYEKW